MSPDPLSRRWGLGTRLLNSGQMLFLMESQELWHWSRGYIALLVRASHQCSLEQRIYSSVGKSISPVFIGAEDI